MRVFKLDTKPESLRIEINRENFNKYTYREKPYYIKDSKGEHARAICPECNNPIVLVGIFKYEGGDRKPYGKHSPKPIHGLGIYNKEKYKNCPFAKNNRTKGGKRKPTDPNAIELYIFMKEHYDCIIEYLERELDFHLPKDYTEKILDDWVRAEGWRYYDTNKINLPYKLLWAETPESLFKTPIKKDSKLYKELLKLSSIKFITANFDQRYVMIKKNNNKFINISFIFTNHKIDNNENETIDINYTMDGKTFFLDTITVNQTLLFDLINSNTVPYSQQRLDIANKIMK